MSSNNFVDGDLVPELGDEIKIVGKTGRIHGLIVYRSERMIRVRPFSDKTNVYEFPLTEDGEYSPELGITETYLDPEKKARDPHFSVQMEVGRGSELEFYDRDGNTSRKVVYQVIATETHDGLKFEDGEVMDFGFVGLPEPYVTFLDVTNVDGDANLANQAANEADRLVPEPEVAANEEDDLIAQLLQQQGDITQDDTAQINKPYPEDQQRQEMFISVMQMIAPKAEQQKNPRVLRRAYIETDLLAALKRSVVQLNSQGQPLLNTSKSLIVDTVDDLLQHMNPPPPFIMPIVQIQKTLTTALEDLQVGNLEYVSERSTLTEAKDGFDEFAKAINQPRRTNNAFEMYQRQLAYEFKPYASHTSGNVKVAKDMEVYVGAPGDEVQGFANLPVLVKKGEYYAVSMDDTKEVAVYAVRLLAAGKSFADPIANKVITLQPADTAKRTGAILLSPELAYTRIGEQSSVLLWDIHASEWSRNSRFRARLFEAKDLQVFREDEPVNVLVSAVLHSRLQPSLSLVSWANACVMDSIGLRSLELTREQMYVFHLKLVKGQLNWDLAMTKMKEETFAHLSQESTFAIKPVIAMKDTPMYSEAILADATLAGFMEKYNGRETLLKNYDLAFMASLMDETYFGTLLAYWSALASQTSQELIEETRRVYISETQKQLRKQETQRELHRRFVAAPTINKCPHVREYEIVNKLNNDGERMKALEAFVRKFNGGAQNNFVKCSKCIQNLVCKHELLLIQEYKIQDQFTAIHKQLVLEFGGPVFMGTYICKNCGQKISNLEFDTHLEFDDEGRPLVGRNVLLPDEDGAAQDEEASRAAHDAKAAYITDSSKNLQKDFALYQNIKRVFEEAHILLSDELAKTLLHELKIFLGTLPLADKYGELQKQIKTLPPYDNFYQQQIVSAIGALAVIELQNLPADIPIPNRACPYSRSGFPIDYLDGVKTDPIDMGAIKYITSVIGLIKSTQAPWSEVLWADIKNPDERHKMIQGALVSALASMRGVDKTLKTAKPPIPTLTDAQTKRLRAAFTARTTVLQVRVEENGVPVEMKPSDADRLPSHFHPGPRYEQTSAADAIKMGNADRFESNVRSAAIPEIKPVVGARMQQLQQDIMYQLNEDVNTSVANRTFSMKDVATIGLGYKSSKLSEPLRAEYDLMSQSYKYLDRRDSSRPNTGTHYYVPWEAPPADEAEIRPDESIYYKLFTKVCAIGDNVGGIHEFTYGNVCRYCRFQLHDALIYETNSEIPPAARNVADIQAAQAERRKASVEDACRAIGVSINEISFNELRAVINTRKQVAERFDAKGGNAAERVAALGQFLPEAANEALGQIIAGLQTIAAENLRGDARYRPLNAFYRAMDAAQTQLVNAIVALLPTTHTEQQRRKRTVDTFTKLEAILAKVRGDECLRSVKRIFIMNSRFIRTEKLTPSMPVQRWIPNVYGGHLEDLQKRIASLDTLVQTSHEQFEEQFSAEDDPTGNRDALADALQHISLKLGTLLRYWQMNIRPNQLFAIQENVNEYSAVLRWCILTIVNSEMEALNAPEVRPVKRFIAEWMLNSIDAEDKTYATYRKSPEEIKASMNDRREREKAHKIKKQDDEKDPEIRKLMRTALKLGYGEDAILRKTGYNADAEALRFAELQALGVAGDRGDRGNAVNPEEGMGDVRDEDGGDI